MASLSRPSFSCLATWGAKSFDWFFAWVKVKIRSKATPKDHIDMMNKTTATALATIPIVCHICNKSTVHPPQTRLRVLIFDVSSCTYFRVKFTVTVMMTGTGTPFKSVGVYVH